MKTKLKYLVLSDIHLGHRVNKTENIYHNMIAFFVSHDELIKDIDFLFIAGDIFDNFLTSYSKDYLLATHTLTYIINWCKQYKVRLRILEGTPSHDWKQSQVITSVIEKLHIDIDYLYVDDLYIEQNKEFGINILYIPDEYNPKASVTLKQVKNLMKTNNLQQVDIGIFHGQFHYQLPMIKLESSHDEKEYLNIVKYYISIGHIHTHSHYDRIIAQGSFDRLTHGEEEDKGGVLIKIDLEKETSEWLFLKNKHAMIFKTFDLTNSTDIDNDIRKCLKSTPKYSSVRFIVNDKDKTLEKLQEFKRITKDYIIKIVVPDIKTLSYGDQLLNEQKIISFSITKDNIETLVKSELETKYSDVNNINKTMEYFKNILLN